VEKEILIRELNAADWSDVWRMIKPVFREGTTYAFDVAISESEAYKLWAELPARSFVAVTEEGEILGSFYIKPNFMGNADHICNCGYIVSENARGYGVASKMCIFSQGIAIELNYRAMQFNCVVSTNTGAIRIWQRLGFEIVGTLPQAFRHPNQGYVDAHVMHKLLVSE